LTPAEPPVACQAWRDGATAADFSFISVCAIPAQI
jgi:hypothetical protein